jgi:hypothetical protein
MIASYQWFGSAVCLLTKGWICPGAPFANVTRESGVAEVQILDSQMAHSYYSLAQTERHLGLGVRNEMNVSVEFYPSGKRVEKKAVTANATIQLTEP